MYEKEIDDSLFETVTFKNPVSEQPMPDVESQKQDSNQFITQK